VLASAIGYGSGGLFAKPVYAAGVGWLPLLSWRFLIAAALAWLFVLLRPGTRAVLRGMSRQTLLATVGLGVLFVGNSGTYYAALETVPLSLAALIVYLYPPLVAVLALRFGHALEGRRAWAALGIAVTGVVLAVGGIDVATAPPVSGLVLIVLSPITYAVWIVLAARLSGERPGRTGAEADAGGATLVTGAILMTATAVAYWSGALATGAPVLPADIPGDAWFGIVGVAIVATFIPLQAFYAGAQRVGASQASLISTIEPLWTIVTAGLIFGERLAPIQLVGGALILGGVLLAQTGGRRRADGSEEPALPQPVVRLADE
jgi:drug/metabolite transporter (DMT)-like permease